MFTCDPVGSVLVSVCDTGAALKHAVEAICGEGCVRVPMNSGEIGQVVRDTDLLEDLYLFDDKEIYW